MKTVLAGIYKFISIVIGDELSMEIKTGPFFAENLVVVERFLISFDFRGEHFQPGFCFRCSILRFSACTCQCHFSQASVLAHISAAMVAKNVSF